MKLSVIILNYNVRFFLEQCILSVKRSIKGLDAEIIIVDNNSPDDSCLMVKQKFPEITLIENKENVGFSKANNQAVKIAKGEYVCILNPDTAVTEDTFIKALHFVKDKEDLGALGTFLMDGTGNFLPESKRNLPTPMVSLLKIIGRVSSYYAESVQKEEQGEVAVLVGAFMFLKRKVYEEVGGFDEDYFMYGEDIDLSYKLNKHGYKNYYLGTSTVLHYKGESTSKDAAYLDRFYGAMDIFYKKHFKTNVFFNFIVKSGIFFAKKSKSKRVHKNIIEESSDKTTYVLTENLQLLKNISEKLDGSIKTTSKSIFSDHVVKNSNIIFDTNYMSYSQIFMVMRSLANKGNSFRICPPSSQFILGSDQSDEKGSVLVF